jgi:translation initiation factor 4G
MYSLAACTAHRAPRLEKLSKTVAGLYKVGMLTLRLMHECVLKLLELDPPPEFAIKGLTKLLKTISETIEAVESLGAEDDH